MPTNIKVDRLLLLKALEDEQRKQTEQFKRDMERFRESEKSYPERLSIALEKAAKDVKQGKIPSGAYSNVPKFSGFPERITKPSKNGSACTLQRQIRTLKLSKAETVTVNENSEYIKFICDLG